jgi:DNA-binding NtrC family response regulator
MTSGTPAHTVLIVDDQRVVLRVFGLALESAGYRVLVADNADAALDAVRRESVDAIMIDVTMPFVNGLGLLYRIREFAPSLPIAMITGMPSVPSETLDELETLGVPLYFKPLAPAKIEEIVGALIAGRPA